MLSRLPRIEVETMTARQRWLALGMLSAGLLVVIMDMTILIMALPDLAADLGTGSTAQLWVVDIYSLILAGLLIPMSALADRAGRRKILLLGFALFGLVSVLVLVAQSTGFVIGLRAALGAAGAMIMPTTLSMVRTIFRDPAERARALAIWSVTAGLGAVIGPLVGGTLLEFFSWHAAFLVNVPFVIAAIVAGVTLLPEARDPDPPAWDGVATVLSIAGMVATVWGIKELARNGWTDPASLALLLGGVLLMVLFVLRCLHRKEPLLDVRLFRSKPFTAGTIAALTASLGLGGILLLVAQWLQIVAGFTPIVAGVALLPMALGAILTAPFAPAIADRIGARTVLAAGLAIAGLGMVGLFVITALEAYWQFIAPLALVGVGTGSLAIGSAIIMGSTPAEKAGNAAAIEEAMYDIGNVLGIAVLGSIAAAVYRSGLELDGIVGQQLPGAAIDVARESLVGALEAARVAGLPELASTATTAFVDGLQRASLAGGVIMLVAAVAVFLLVPREFDLGSQH